MCIHYFRGSDRDHAPPRVVEPAAQIVPVDAADAGRARSAFRRRRRHQLTDGAATLSAFEAVPRLVNPKTE